MADMTVEQALTVLGAGTVSGGRLYFDNDQSARQALATLRAELDGLRRDAGRYRWLREKSAGQWEHPIVCSQTRRDSGMLYIGPWIGKELDAAIDAAKGASHEP